MRPTLFELSSRLAECHGVLNAGPRLFRRSLRSRPHHIARRRLSAAELRARGAYIIEGPVPRDYEKLELVLRDRNGLVLAFGEDTSARAKRLTANES